MNLPLNFLNKSRHRNSMRQAKRQAYQQIIAQFDENQMGFNVLNNQTRVTSFSDERQANERPNKVIHFSNAKGQIVDFDVEILEPDDEKAIKSHLKNIQQLSDGRMCVNNPHDLYKAYSIGRVTPGMYCAIRPNLVTQLKKALK